MSNKNVCKDYGEPWTPGRDDMQSYHHNTGEPFTNIYSMEIENYHHVTGDPLYVTVCECKGAEVGKINAHRIATCVNACAGIPSEKLTLEFLQAAIAAYEVVNELENKVCDS